MEMLEKIIKKGNKWQVTDHTGTKNLGTYNTKEEAEKRLKQVEYFKNVKESLDDNLFPNSKVIEENGNLKVVYHGSPYKFDKFERAYSNGHYFMDNKEFASHIYPDIKYLYSAYLNLENPFVIDVCGASWENLLENIPKNPTKTQQELLDRFYDKYSEEGLMIDDLCQELLDEGKYDGIIAKNIKEGPPGNKQYIVTDYVAFNNNQIKILSDKLEEDEVKIETGKEDKNQIAIFADRVANPNITLTDSTVLAEDTSKAFLSKVYRSIKEKENSWRDKAEQEIDFLNSCDYGIIIDDKKIIDSDKIDKIFSSKEGEKFRTLTPKQVKENKVFVCWDAVNYLKSQIPELDEYFIEINNNKTDDCESSHSFCLYEDKDKVYWVEGSWGDFVGIHKFDSKEEAFNKISKEFLKDNGKLKKDENCRIFKFDTYGDKQLNTHQYILNARNGKIVWEYNKELKENIDITRSDNFKKWFGNSKVIDKAGNPLVVYHGSPDARFDVFVSPLEHPLYLGKDKPAYWFTDSYSMAKSYADDTRAFDYQNAIAGVKEVYLKIENPLIIDNLHREWHQTDKSGSSQDFVTKAYNDGYDGIIINNVKDYYYNNRNKSSGTTYVVFNKNQIKSIDNNGNFDPNSDKITEKQEELLLAEKRFALPHRLKEDINFVSYNEVVKKRNENPKFKEDTDTLLKDLPEVCKYSFEESIWDNCQDYSLFEIYKLFASDRMDETSLLLSEDKEEILGWINLSLAEESDIIYSVKFGSFNPTNPRKNYEFFSQLKRYFEEHKNEYKEINWVGDLDYSFVRHYINIIKENNGSIEKAEGNYALFKIGNIDRNKSNVLYANDLKDINNVEELKKALNNKQLKESIDITQSDNFKKWFGNSKAVDKDGNPLVLYHGSTNGHFDIFKNKDNIFYFCDDKEVAEWMGDWSENDSTVYSCYLKMENPLIIDAKENYWDNVYGAENDKDWISTENICESAKYQGYDSVIIYNVYEGDDGGCLTNDYVVFSSNQIKSIDNNGNFDPNSDRITENMDITQSDNFKKWFGNSRVVNRDGSPKIVYHGTNNNFDVFNTSTPSWFSEQEEYSKYYGKNIGKYYLKITNPIDFSEWAQWSYIFNTLKKNNYDFTSKRDLIDYGCKPVSKEYWTSSISDLICSKLDISSVELLEICQNNLDLSNDENDIMHLTDLEIFKKMCQEKGYDGFICDEGGDARTYAIFNPNQVKSATDNNGNFDPNSNKITESEEDIEELDKWVKTWLRDTSKPIDKLSAPNGKESNLNKKQWITVRTPQFKKWFGDWENNPNNSSKVIDNNGEPLVVYHGTEGVFDFFSKDVDHSNSYKEIPNGFYFTNSRQVARHYGSNILACFLKIINPKIIDAEGRKWDNIIYNNQELSTDEIANLINTTEPQYDGVIFKNIVDGSKYLITDYIIFKPNQIKSVENNGEFSMESNKIIEGKNNTGLSPVPNDYIIDMTTEFKRDIKQLKFDSNDIEDLKVAIKNRPPRAQLKHSLYKFDFWPKKYNLSPSEGRVIYYRLDKNKRVILMRAYSKKKESDLSSKEYDAIIKNTEKYYEL